MGMHGGTTDLGDYICILASIVSNTLIALWRILDLKPFKFRLALNCTFKLSHHLQCSVKIINMPYVYTHFLVL